MHTVINIKSLKDFGVILILELHVWRNNKERAILTPITHYN